MRNVAEKALKHKVQCADVRMLERLIRSKDLSGLIQCVEQGVQAKVVVDLPRRRGSARRRISAILGVSDRRMQRWSLTQLTRLPQAIGEKAVRLLQRRRQAISVFDNEVDALTWMNEPNEAFAGRLPIDHARSEFGCRQVERLLTRIDSSVHS